MIAALADAVIYPAAAIMAPCALGILWHEWRRAVPRYRALCAWLAVINAIEL